MDIKNLYLNECIYDHPFTVSSSTYRPNEYPSLVSDGHNKLKEKIMRNIILILYLSAFSMLQHIMVKTIQHYQS